MGRNRRDGGVVIVSVAEPAGRGRRLVLPRKWWQVFARELGAKSAVQLYKIAVSSAHMNILFVVVANSDDEFLSHNSQRVTAHPVNELQSQWLTACG